MWKQKDGVKKDKIACNTLRVNITLSHTYFL